MTADTLEQSSRLAAVGAGQHASRVVRVLKPVLPPPTLEAAAAALADAETALQRWTTDAENRGRLAEQAAADLAEAQSVAGDAAYETPANLESLSADLVRRRAELEVSHSAAAAAQNRVDDARRALLLARADDVAARAARLREVAAARQAHTDKLLAVLNAHERTQFRAGDHTSMLPSVVPLTQRLLDRASWLDGQARELRSTAGGGNPAQVAAVLGRPVPQIDIEAEALAGDLDPAAGGEAEPAADDSTAGASDPA